MIRYFINDVEVTEEDINKYYSILLYCNTAVENIKNEEHYCTSFIGLKEPKEQIKLREELDKLLDGIMKNKKGITKKELLNMPAGTKIYTNVEICNEWIKSIEGIFLNACNNEITEWDIEENLTFDKMPEYGTKIIKIEVPTYETVWEEKEEVKEMTMEEIEEKLGYKIKIVKEKE